MKSITPLLCLEKPAGCPASYKGMKLREGNINNFLISTVLSPGGPIAIFLLLGDINQAIVNKVT